VKASGYRHYLLGVLLVILAFNSVDRLALGLVLQDVKNELRLSDTQLGLMSGIAFALFYSVMGLPIARWADRGNRVTIISLTTALWSAAVALCGTASTFLQLLLMRAAVAVGEAGCIPPAHSLIADYFARAERARAVSIYMLGGPLSVVVGYFLAGKLNELFGWRAMFMILGLPGLVLAAVTWISLREPRALPCASDKASEHSNQSVTTQSAIAQSSPVPGLMTVCRTLWTIRTFRQLVFCFSIVSFFAYGVLQWQPTFFIRSFGMNTAELGGWFALIYGAGGLAGTYAGGALASRYGANDERWQLRAIAVVFALFGVLSAFIYLSPSRTVALALMSASAVVGAMVNGPLFAIIQTLVPERMRATSIVLVYLTANLVGMGLGPLAVGALSDGFQPWAADQSLRYALLVLCPCYFWGSWHLVLASRTVAHDLQR
jgi:MFS family permease